jgi:two-component system response regulator EvgA
MIRAWILRSFFISQLCASQKNDISYFKALLPVGIGCKNKEGKMKKALIVDDHPLVRMAVRIILERNNIEILAEVGDGAAAVSQTKKWTPDLVVLDIGIPKLDGLSVISRLRELGMSLKILVLSSQAEEHFASRCAQAGAQGFVSKSENLGELEDAIKMLRAGRVYFPVAGNVMMQMETPGAELDKLNKLSSRELIVLQYLARGWSNKSIAGELFLSNKTISTYKTRLLTKLDAKNLVDLIELAKRHSLVE